MLINRRGACLQLENLRGHCLTRLGWVTLAVSFPDELPRGYSWIADEPTFDPSVHLQLEPPSSITTLTELGYSDEDIAPHRWQCPRRLGSCLQKALMCCLRWRASCGPTRDAPETASRTRSVAAAIGRVG